MKKIVILSLLVILLLSFQTPATQPAYYSSLALGPSLTYQASQSVNANWFTDKRDGVVTLSGDTWTPAAGVTGLINVSGTCSLKREPTRWVMWLNVGGTLYTIVSTDQTTASFSIAVPVAPMQVIVYQEFSLGANSIKCTLLFEPVY